MAVVDKIIFVFDSLRQVRADETSIGIYDAHGRSYFYLNREADGIIRQLFLKSSMLENGSALLLQCKKQHYYFLHRGNAKEFVLDTEDEIRYLYETTANEIYALGKTRTYLLDHYVWIPTLDWIALLKSPYSYFTERLTRPVQALLRSRQRILTYDVLPVSNVDFFSGC